MSYIDLIGKEKNRDHKRRRFFAALRGNGNPRRARKKYTQAQSSLVSARALAGRILPTPLEALVWEKVRASRLGIRIRQQAPIGGRYIADFLIPSVKVILELDGGIHTRLGNERYDAHRDQWIAERGYVVLRIDNETAAAELDRLLGQLSEFTQRLAIEDQAQICHYCKRKFQTDIAVKQHTNAKHLYRLEPSKW